ncbi:MAG: acyloxyacyl hydrolase, partial [Catalinimonas sp.]
MPVRRLLFWGLLLLWWPGRAQLYLEPELQAGLNVPNYLQFPRSGVRTAAAFSVAWRPAAAWARHYRRPYVGVQLLTADLGNRSRFGWEWSTVPFLEFGALAHRRRPGHWRLKLGLGASYITRPHDPTDNPGNLVIGSRANWTFQAFLYRRLWHNDRWTVRAGGGYTHHSNAHTQLPN